MKFTIYSQTSTLHRWSLGTDKWFHPTFHNGCYYLSMPGSKSIRVSKRGPNVVNVLLTSLVLLRPHGVLVRVTPGTPLSVRVMIRAAQITVSYTAHGQQVSALNRSRLTPVWGPYLLEGPDLLGDTHRPEPGTVSQISSTFTDILMASF